MAKKLAIGNVVDVPVKFTINNAGKTVAHSVTLVCDRLDNDEIQKRLNELTVKEFVTEVTTGWKNQRIVVEEDGTPSEFDAEGLEVLFSLPGAPNLAFSAYLKECGAKEKN